MTNMQTIQIEAFDTLFFKDGKPFSMGEDTWADGIFPPPPSVMYGALRTAYAAANPEGITFGRNGNVDEKTAGLEIHSIYYRVSSAYASSIGEAYLPLPLDLVEQMPKIKQAKDESTENYQKLLKVFLEKEQREKRYKLERLKPVKSLLSASSFPSHFDVAGYWDDMDSQVDSVDDGLIRAGDLWMYLKNKLTEPSCIRLKDYLLTESKIGIKRNKQTGTTGVDGELYRVDMRRPQNGKEIFTLHADVTAPTGFHLGDSLMKLGAEGKSAKLRLGNSGLSKPSEIKGKDFIIYLATPGLFKNGSFPDMSKLSDKFNLKARIRGMVSGKPVMIGGFDMKKAEPKAMLKAVPAGTIFYCQAEEEVLFDPFQGMSISDFREQEGFGIAYFGIYQPVSHG